MSSRKKNSALLLQNQMCFPLYAASRLTTKMYEPMLQELGITYTQYLVLLVLWQQDHRMVNEIGQALFLESNTLTPLLKRLEQKELLRRSRSREDERKVLISLTARGIAIKKAAQQIPEKIMGRFSGEAFSEEEAVRFQQQLFQLVRMLSEQLQPGAAAQRNEMTGPEEVAGCGVNGEF